MSSASPERRGRRGRPTVYTPELADEICERLAAGESLNAICQSSHMPAESKVRQWALDDQADKAGTGRGFAARYARARAAGFELMAEEIITISDANYVLADGTVDNGAVAQARLRSDNRKWLLAKMLPKRFGDRVMAEITGDANAPLLTKIEIVAVAPRHVLIEDGGADGGAEPEVTPQTCLPPRSSSAE